MVTRVSRIHSFISRDISSMKLFPAFQMVIKIDFSSSILFFRKREIDFSQTNNLDNCPIYIAVIELKYPESQYLNHQMFDRLPRFPFFHMVFEHQYFALQITRSKMLIKTSVRAETSFTFGTYMRISICICTSVR